MPAHRSMVLLHGVSASHRSWWRIVEDLTELGWDARALDLLGHGDRAALGGEQLRVDDLASDVLDRIPEPVDLVVGHSLGAIVALSAVQVQPDITQAVVVEDPPALATSPTLDDVADGIVTSVRETRVDPAAARRSLLAENPRWSLVEAQNVVQNRLQLDLDRVVGLLRTESWDLPALVEECPVPVHLLAATRDSALLEPDRTAVMAMLPPAQRRVIDSGHVIHRDRPGLWLHHVVGFATS